jgi:hypothetical protein
MNHFRISVVILLVALAALPGAALGAASGITNRTALVGTWACAGTLHGRTGYRGEYLTFRPDGSGTVQIRTPGSTGPAITLKHAPWWNSFNATNTLTWVGPNHFTMTHYASVSGMSLDCLRT